MFTRAIVRLPCKYIDNGLSAANLGTPDYERARIQHAQYVKALEDCGLEVHKMDADEDYPDSVFIEDIALLTPRCAIITNPGAPSRRGETAGVREVLQEYYEDIHEIQSPGTLEAGDVMMAGKQCYIGLSERTNAEGAEQLLRLLKKFGITGSIIEIRNLLHLKTGVSYLENNTMLVAPELKNRPFLDGYKSIEIPAEERYAANCIWVNGTVMVPEGYPVTKQKIKEAGYDHIRTVETSEFRKLDGGLSCLSLRF